MIPSLIIFYMMTFGTTYNRLKQQNKISLEDVKEAGEKHLRMVTFSWDIIDICQYKCSYCSAVDFNKHTFDTNDQRRWRSVVSRLKLNRLGVDFSVELLGGEPTLHPDILLIIESLNKIKSCRRIELVTNLAKNITFFKKLDDIKYNKLIITPSYHPEYYKDSFLEKIVKISKFKNVCVRPNINLSDNPKHWPGLLHLFKLLDDNNVTWGANFLQEVPGSWKPKYSNDFYNIFSKWLRSKRNVKINKRLAEIANITSAGEHHRDQAEAVANNIPYKLKTGEQIYISEEDIVRDNLREFTGWVCTPLMYHIDMKGMISNHCTGEILNITDNSDFIFKERICKLNCCDCDTKYHYYKRRMP